MDTESPILINMDGLLAGERYLREHSEEFDDGTVEGTHVRFIASILSQVFHASHIAFQMPDVPPYTSGQTDAVGHPTDPV